LHDERLLLLSICGDELEGRRTRSFDYGFLSISTTKFKQITVLDINDLGFFDWDISLQQERLVMRRTALLLSNDDKISEYKD